MRSELTLSFTVALAIFRVNMTKKYGEFGKRSHWVGDIYMALREVKMVLPAWEVHSSKCIFGAQHFVRIILLLYLQKVDYRYQIC